MVTLRSVDRPRRGAFGLRIILMTVSLDPRGHGAGRRCCHRSAPGPGHRACHRHCPRGGRRRPTSCRRRHAGSRSCGGQRGLVAGVRHPRPLPRTVAAAGDRGGLFREHDTILLDEPTASIDPLEEQAVYERFMQIAAGRTAIIVTHRLASARLADRILVLDAGRIVEDGTHEHLLARRGLYHRICSRPRPPGTGGVDDSRRVSVVAWEPAAVVRLERLAVCQHI